MFQIEEVYDIQYVPEAANPFDEPLTSGQFVLWTLAETVSDADDDRENTQHSFIRKQVTTNYLAQQEGQ